MTVILDNFSKAGYQIVKGGLHSTDVFVGWRLRASMHYVDFDEFFFTMKHILEQSNPQDLYKNKGLCLKYLFKKSVWTKKTSMIFFNCGFDLSAYDSSWLNG